jgi:hypothetical protein
MIKLVNLLKEAEEEIKCPVATQDISVNLEHRQKAIDEYGYGPLNPNNPNIKFWKKKAEEWQLDSMEEAKSSRCNNCAAFNITSKILNCIEKGIVSGEKEVPVSNTADAPVAEGEDNIVTEPEVDDTEGAEKNAWDTIEAGKLGYCTFLKFKCAGSRTCNAWVVGGPIKDK